MSAPTKVLNNNDNCFTPPGTPPSPRREWQGREVVNSNSIPTNPLLEKIKIVKEENETVRAENKELRAKVEAFETLQKKNQELSEKVQNLSLRNETVSKQLEDTEKKIESNQRAATLLQSLMESDRNDGEITFAKPVDELVLLDYKIAASCSKTQMAIANLLLSKDVEEARTNIEKRVASFNKHIIRLIESKTLDLIIENNQAIKQQSDGDLIKLRNNKIVSFNQCMVDLRRLSDCLKDFLKAIDPKDTRLPPTGYHLTSIFGNPPEFTAKRIFVLPGPDGFTATADTLQLPENWEHKPAVAFLPKENDNEKK